MADRDTRYAEDMSEVADPPVAVPNEDTFNAVARINPYDDLDGDVPLQVPRERSSEEVRGEPGFRTVPTARLETAAMYRGIADFFDIDPDLVYHPAPKTQVAPSAAFPNSNVLYVDLESKHTDELAKHGYSAIPADAQEFDLVEELSESADVIIYYDATNVDLEAATRGNLSEDGWIISDERYQAADVLDDLQLEAKVRLSQEGFVEIDTENLEDYYERVESEEEFRERHPELYRERRKEVDERVGENVDLIDGLREIERMDAMNEIHNFALNDRRMEGKFDHEESDLDPIEHFLEDWRNPEANLPLKKVGNHLTVYRRDS